MGYVIGSQVAKGGAHLIDVLRRRGKARFGDFYDATEETEASVHKACGFDEDTDTGHACLYVEWAAGQMEKQGLVTIEANGGTLADGEPDFEIKATAKLWDLIECGGMPRYWDMDL